MAEIFFSYRRQDSESATGRLADALEAHFGDDRVLRDREFAAGEDFVAAIRRSIESSTVMLVVVGRRWLGAADAKGRRRLDDPADFVRLEIELALASGTATVPVLVEGAAMPAPTELPVSMAAFSRCQAVELSDRRWRDDVDALIATLQSRFAIQAAPSVASRGRTGLALSRLAADLLELMLHPRRLIARRQTGGASDALRAFLFLCAAILIGNLILLAGIDIAVVAQGSAAQVVLGIAAWLATALLLGLFVAGLLIGTLALAWRVVERSAGYRRVGLVGAYVYGGCWLGSCAGAVIVLSAVQLFDPGFIDRTLAALHAAAAAATSALPPMRPLSTAPLRGAVATLLVLGAVLWLATAVWSIAAWAAFRQALGATRLQATAATATWLAILAALFGLGTRLA